MPTVITWVGFSAVPVFFSVCLISHTKTQAARITELDVQIFHYESWKLILGSTAQRSRSCRRRL